MINRSLARIRVFQALYAYYLGEGTTVRETESELRLSLDSTHSLYLFLLDLVPSLTALYTEQQERRRKRLIRSKEDENPNMVLSGNLLAQKIDHCDQLADTLREKDLSWRRYDETLRLLLEEILSTDIYKQYSAQEHHTYKEDAAFWVTVLSRYTFRNTHLDDLLQDISIYWDRSYDYTEKIEVEEMPHTDEIEQTVKALKEEENVYNSTRLAISPVEVQKDFALKTLKRSCEEKLLDSILMPMYRDKEDEVFPYELLRATLHHGEHKADFIDSYLVNWDSDRLTTCDKILLKMGTAEFLTFPNIPVSVTINEYVEIAKAFSTVKSGAFVNGLLDKIAKDLNKEGSIQKPL